MSKLSEYSKFDKLDTDDEDEDVVLPTSVRTSETERIEPSNDTSTPSSFAPRPNKLDRGRRNTVIKKHPNIDNRFVFEYENQEIYQFEQSLSEVTIYIPAPPKNVGKVLCEISPNHVQLYLHGSDRYFLNHDTYEKVDTNESTWCYEHDEDNAEKIVIYLHKMAKGLVWKSVFKGEDTELDLMALEKVNQTLLLERWQEENPGMDFRGATFNGSAPDPRTFMGGVKYS